MSTDVHLITREEYHRMLDAGVLEDPSSVELVDGVLIEKMGKNGPHCVCLDLLRDLLLHLLPDGWVLRLQDPIVTDLGEPEPDAAVVKGTARDFVEEHPSPGQIGLLVEVADASLSLDRGGKAEAYARNSIPQYWIVNLIERRIEVYSDPSGPAVVPFFHSSRIYVPGQSVPLALADRTIGEIPVSDVLP